MEGMIDLCVLNEWVGNDEMEVGSKKRQKKRVMKMDGQSGKEGNGGGRGRSTSTSWLGSKVGLGVGVGVRLALSPLLPRFPLLPVSCHAVPSCCRLPPAVPRCANEPLGGQRGDYDGTTLADLVYVPKRWALTGSLRPVVYARRD